ncbi:MAG: hypothetical protein N2043_01985 [Ignavibacterium sp.]|nr:hypothetical protein [Ignavibacterium sp.]
MNQLPERGMMTSKMTKKDLEKFKKPAVVCQICGQKMTFSKEWGKWERKWSIHRPCYEETLYKLDMLTGIASIRKQEEERRQRKMEEMRRKYGL